MSVTVAGGTKIEWADFTFNPWWGCERVSPACAHCYADDWAERFGMQLWGEGHDFRFFPDAHWNIPLKLARTAPAKLGRRPRVFCASMADVFEERPELDEHRERLFDLIQHTGQLDWLILTKRPEFARDWLARTYPAYGERNDPLPNVWMGVSIENSRFTWRADVLREIPAAVRFISAEPLLGSVFDAPDGICGSCNHTTRGHRGGFCDTEVCDYGEMDCGCKRQFAQQLDLTGIDWVIIGGESGPKARPFHLEHAREIISACKRVSRCSICDDAPISIPGCDCVARGRRPAVFVKQLGAKPLDSQLGKLVLADRKGGDISEFPTDLRIREFPRSAA